MSTSTPIPPGLRKRGLPLPQTLEDLTDPAYKGLLVAPTRPPRRPGSPFCWRPIAHFGEEGYLDFWQALQANDVLITDGWSEAYFEHFTVGSGGAGDRPLVVSYSTSPPADVVYATDGRTAPASVNLMLPGAPFRQVEFVGVLAGRGAAGTGAPVGSTSCSTSSFRKTFRCRCSSTRPTQRALPELFTQFAQTPPRRSRFDPAAIEANRERWVQAWADAVSAVRARLRSSALIADRVIRGEGDLLYVLPAGAAADLSGLFYLYPLLAILRVSFARGGRRATWAQMLGAPVGDARFWRLLWFTTWQAALSTVLTVLAGLPLAYVFATLRLSRQTLLHALLTIPFVMPTVVVAGAFMALLIGRNGLLNQWLQQLLQPGRAAPPPGADDLADPAGHVFYNVSVIIRTVGGFWSNLNPHLANPRRCWARRRWRTFAPSRCRCCCPACWPPACSSFSFASPALA
jgi:ABC-type sulfate transport system permease component